MTGILPTTSFGRRAPSLAQAAAEARTRLEAARAPEPVHKWRLHRALVEARAAFALPDGALSVLQALLSFHPETALTLDADDPSIVVHPSNRELSMRLGGAPESTLRRHLGTLVAAGLIARRDSPNGKRYARRDADGETTAVFGFDLGPFVASKGRIEAAASQVRAEAARVRMLREKISLLRRNCAGAVVALEEAGVGQADHFTADLARLAALPRRAPVDEIEAHAYDLEALAGRLDASLTTSRVVSYDVKMSGNAAHNERHIQNQTQTPIESEPASQEARGEVRVVKPDAAFPLPLIAKTFPTLRDYARGGRIDRPADLIDAANLARASLGVSPSAWAEAQAAMGQGAAAIAVAAMLERADEIHSAGGYLRALTAKARAGAFATGPLVMAQMKRAAPARAG